MNRYNKSDGLFSGEGIGGNDDEKGKYAKIFKTMPCPVILLDKNNNIREINYKASCAFKNVDLQNELDKVILKLKDELNAGKFNQEDMIKSEILTEEGIRYFEIRITPMSCIEDLGYMLVFNDFTEHKLLEESLKKEKAELETNNINKNKFLTSISHEIRTAINGIIGMTDLTLMTELSLEQKENLNLVKTSGLKLLNIVNSILDFSKIQLEKIKLENVEFNFKEFINEIIRINSLKALENKLEFKAKVDEDIPEMLTGDPMRVKQILDNIIDNAIGFTKYGTISLIIEKEETYDKKVNLKMYVKDTGIGIDKKDISKLFKGFNQIDNKNYIKKHRGAGLGLPICKGLVEKMGGRIEVKSKKDVGTTFSFNIILEKGKKYNSINLIDKNDKHTSNLKINKRLNILIAEDDRASQMVIYNLFRKYGHICDVVNNGQEALKMIENKKYDLILMDIQMPVMDGIQATKMIRKSEENAGRHIPIIALTAYALKGDREKLLESGMDNYISKPFNVEELLQTVYNSVKDDPVNFNATSKKNSMNEEALFLYLL